MSVRATEDHDRNYVRVRTNRTGRATQSDNPLSRTFDSHIHLAMQICACRKARHESSWL